MNQMVKGDPLREAAEELERHIREVAQVPCPVRHLFAPGVYLREMTIPGGTVVVGAVHLNEHLAILSKGRIRLSTEGGVVEYEAPATVHSYPGIKRICYALTDTVITTIHHNPTDTQDMDEITAHHVDTPRAELLTGEANAQSIIGASKEQTWLGQP